jgi:hypothetical protein
MRAQSEEESVKFNTLRMHAVCKHKYMKNIQMKRTLKILGGENEKGISYHPKKENPDSEAREKNHQERDKRKRAKQRRKQ